MPKKNKAQMDSDARAVFLSYASEDSAEVLRIAEAFKRNGIEVWLDVNELRGGDSWDQRIRQQVQSCALFVPVISRRTQARREGYFRREWRLAVERTHDMSDSVAFLVPVVIDDIDPRSADVPSAFRAVQWTTLKGGHATEAFLAQVARLLQPTLASVSPSPEAGSADIGGSAKTGRRPRPRARIAVAMALLIAAAGWLISHNYRPKSAAGAYGSSKSIAVLPFLDMSAQHNEEYFGDGIAEEILNLLTKIPGLTVIGRTSSFQFKGQTGDLRTIGKQLNAAFLLQGSVRNSGGQIRITGQLINAQTGAQEWSEIYNRQIDDVLGLQEAIARSVVRELQLSMSSESSRQQTKVRNAEAYDLYLRGLHAADRVDRDGVAEATNLFENALRLDPPFADAAAALSQAYILQVALVALPPADGFRRARLAAEQALRYDAASSRARVALSWIHMMSDWNWDAAERELRAAESIAPGDVEVLKGEAELSYDLGRYGDALRLIKLALAQDPLDAEAIESLSTIQSARGEVREAEAAMRRALEIRPNYGYGHYNLCLIALQRGDGASALQEIEQETMADGKLQGLALAYHALGRHAEADAALAELIKEQARDSALDIANTYAFRGQPDQAIEWLQRALDQKDPWLFRVKGSFLMRGLKNDPRYQAMLRKLNL